MKNPKAARALMEVITEGGLQDGCNKAMGALVYIVAMKFPQSAVKHRPFILQYIKDLKLKSNDQV